MYSRLAELLRIFTPKAYLMLKEDQKSFASPYVVGIEYIDGLHPFKPDELDRVCFARMEYAEQFALSAMFEQADTL